VVGNHLKGINGPEPCADSLGASLAVGNVPPSNSPQSTTERQTIMKTKQYQPHQPKTGQPCYCKRGQQRDNCPQCEGTGLVIDFQAIRSEVMAKNEVFDPIYYESGVFRQVVDNCHQTDDSGKPLSAGWYYWFRRGRTKDSDIETVGGFKSRGEATSAMNEAIEEERERWEESRGRPGTT